MIYNLNSLPSAIMMEIYRIPFITNGKYITTCTSDINKPYYDDNFFILIIIISYVTSPLICEIGITVDGITRLLTIKYLLNNKFIYVFIIVLSILQAKMLHQ